MRSIPGASRPAAILAVTVVLGLSAGCGGEPVKFAGESVEEPEAFLSTIERTWRSDIAQDRVTKHKDARCYFSTPADGDSKTIEQIVYCGPVRHYTEKSASEAADDAKEHKEAREAREAGDLEDDEGPEPGDAGPGSWDTYVFQAISSDPGSENSDYQLIDPRPELWGAEVTGGMKLFRPDGEEPPADASKLAAPKPPPVDNGYVKVTDEVDIKQAKQPQDARIVTPRTTVTVSQLGTTDQFETDEGRRGPANGEKFVVAKVGLADGPFAERYQNAWGDEDLINADVTYALQVGDDRKRLDLSSQYSASDTQTATIVASVPKNSDPQLLVSAAGKDQTISLTTGKRTSRTAEAFYQTRSETGVSRQYATKTFKKGDFALSLSLLFSNAQLVPFDPDDVTSIFEVPDDATTFSVTYKPTFTFSSSESAEFYQPTNGAGTLTPLTFDVSFEK
jgi:hypothetical protein